MTAYITKFNLKDTAYLIDTGSIMLIPVTITDIYLHDSCALLGSSPAKPTYRVSYINALAPAQTKVAESDLYYLSEGKSIIEGLISNRLTDLEDMR